MEHRRCAAAPTRRVHRRVSRRLQAARARGIATAASQGRPVNTRAVAAPPLRGRPDSRAARAIGPPVEGAGRPSAPERARTPAAAGPRRSGPGSRPPTSPRATRCQIPFLLRPQALPQTRPFQWRRCGPCMPRARYLAPAETLPASWPVQPSPACRVPPAPTPRAQARPAVAPASRFSLGHIGLWHLWPTSQRRSRGCRPQAA